MATMSKTFRQYSDSGEEICTLCCEVAGAWAVGTCEHPVCLTCSARLRVLCEQKECPVCREKNDRVIVFQKPQRYIVPSSSLQDRKYGFVFAKSSLMKYYDGIRSIRCSVCLIGNFPNFKTLSEHTRREHDLHFCEICVEHLKLFPSEHKLYSRSDLVRHRRQGDPDDRSHKGHPQCQFCDERYFGKDELFFHLKKNHFWCHFCEQAGNQEYYPNYEALKGHFRKDHFLCEEGPCRYEKYTTVFLSKLDLQVHKAKIHAKGLSKNEAKQLRQVEVGFTYSRKERGEGMPPLSYRQYWDGDTRDQQRELDIAKAISLQETEPEIKPIKSLMKPLDMGGSLPTKHKQEGHHHYQVRGGERDKPSERKKPPGLEQAGSSLPQSITLGCSVIASSSKPDDEDDDDDNRDEWPSLGLDVLQKSSSPPITTTFPPGIGTSNKPYPSGLLPPPPPPPGFSSSHVTVNAMKSSESDIFEDAQRLLGYDAGKINYFRVQSGHYLKGDISVLEYHHNCSELFRHNWTVLGSRLADTLPNLQKRQELHLLLNSNKLSVNRPQPPPPGFTIPLATTTITKNNNNDGRKSKKKRNRHENTISNTTRSSSNGGGGGVWPVVGSGNSRIRLNDSEFPSLNSAAQIPDPRVPVTSWNMKVAVK